MAMTPLVLVCRGAAGWGAVASGNRYESELLLKRKRIIDACQVAGDPADAAMGGKFRKKLYNTTLLP
ncbi:MAG: hypothetical protein F9K32_09665 [Desulfobulbaceae bacterium]|nr:MAG: hypothetical protein F9K32_09665 [Desulfobulbaceae bacterium]